MKWFQVTKQENVNFQSSSLFLQPTVCMKHSLNTIATKGYYIWERVCLLLIFAANFLQSNFLVWSKQSISLQYSIYWKLTECTAEHRSKEEAKPEIDWALTKNYSDWFLIVSSAESVPSNVSCSVFSSIFFSLQK